MMREFQGAAVAVTILVVTAGSALAQSAEKAPPGSYVGAAKCKMCHMSESKGAQYKIWAAGPHAKAFATLGTPEAAEIAKKAGVTGSPQQAPLCLECHVTGAKAKAELRTKIKPEEGVGCESCHGPGAAYMGMDVMKALFAGTTEPASVGLILPTAKTCTACHNERSPTYKPFDFAKMNEKVKHPYPAEFAAKRGRKD
jgi:hypothetical protein